MSAYALKSVFLFTGAQARTRRSRIAWRRQTPAAFCCPAVFARGHRMASRNLTGCPATAPLPVRLSRKARGPSVAGRAGRLRRLRRQKTLDRYRLQTSGRRPLPANGTLRSAARLPRSGGRLCGYPPDPRKINRLPRRLTKGGSARGFNPESHSGPAPGSGCR